MLEFSHLDWMEILKHLQDFATSGAGKMSLAQMKACSSPSEAQTSMDQILEGQQIISAGVRPFMESLDLFEPWYSRIRKSAVLKPLEVKDVRNFCLEVLALDEVVRIHRGDWCQKLKNNLMPAQEPLSAIDQILTPRGDIRSDASETLYRLTREKDSLTKQIQNSLDKLVNDHQMTNYLQDKFVTTREGRWVLPIKSGHQHSVSGVIHGSSQTKQTVFMEPEAVLPLNNRLRQVEVEIEEEIERLLIQLSNYLETQKEGFTKSRDLLEEADVVLAKAQWSQKIQAEKINFSEQEIFLVDVKHPLLQLSPKKPVANTVKLDDKKSVLLLSGPNAGGKTVLLKSIGLAAQMARCGLPICSATGSRLPFFESIKIAIGDSQNVEEELSTFAAHLKILESATLVKGPVNLILVDEICGSTDPEEGAALARAFIEKFADNGCFAVITSHLSPLKSGWAPESPVLNGSLEYDAKTGRPTYQFLQGIPGDSLAIQTAKRIGISSTILSRATELLSPITRQRLAGLEELDQLKGDIHKLQSELRKELNKAQSQKEKYEGLLKEFERDKENQLQKTIRQTEKKLDEMISQAKVDQTFKRHTALQEIKTQLPEVVKSKAGISSSGGIDSAEEFGRRFPPGSKVFVKQLQQDGIVQSLPTAKGDVTILSNSIRLSLPWTDLQPPNQQQNPTAHLVRKKMFSNPTGVSVPLQDQERVVDLRGLTVEEALSELEIQLDRSAENKEDRVKIIHGHGTEALKKSVRAYLSRSVYVKKWKAGSPEQGGDGITWVELEV